MAPYTVAQDTGGRSHQEDRYVAEEMERGYFFGVFDGHGGAEVSDMAATIAPQFFSSAFKKRNYRGCLKAMTRQLHETTKMLPSGTSMSVVFIPKKGRYAYAAVLGDSPILWHHKKKVCISPDHNIRSNPAEAAAAAARGGQIVNGYLMDPQAGASVGLQMARALGNVALDRVLAREPEIFKFPVSPKKPVIIASDGLLDPGHRVERQAEQIEILYSLARSGGEADVLLQDALSRQTHDNVTVIVYRHPAG
ncbi:MAG: protein serine/threonine phosphatase 2C family protein [Elusimicrobia bacterium]|nr:protein serine/threonine phosphatase 2C family protein [Elusimicrobiota bacterium]